jgi:hypothetical protein
MQEELLLRSNLSNLLTSAENWIAVAYVAGMFLVLAFRPQQVGETFSFRMSYRLFATYLILPSVVSVSLWLSTLDTQPVHTRTVGGNTGTWTVAVFQLSSLTARVLLALGISFALRSMTRGRGFPIPYPPETRGSIPSPLG